MVTMSKVSLENTDSQSFQLWYIMFLKDWFGNSNDMDYSSPNSRQLVRSVQGNDIFAIPNSVEVAIMEWHELKEIFRRDVPLRMMTDLGSLFTTRHNSSSTIEKNLMFDISAARKTY